MAHGELQFVQAEVRYMRDLRRLDELCFSERK